MSGSLQVSDGRTVAVRDGLVLGRVAGCDLVIDDAKCSRRHARLVVQGGVVEIEDLDSSNGTLLNGKPVQKRVLRDGDEIRIGKTVLTFRETEGAAKAPIASDEVDLFGDDDAATAGRADAAPPPPPAAKPARPATVEFVDEVVEVKKPRPALATPSGVGARTGEPVVVQKGRVLQFSVQKDGGALDDDLAQMGSGMRTLVVVGVVALFAGLFWLAMSWMS